MKHDAFFTGLASLVAALLGFGVLDPFTPGAIGWAVAAGLWFLLWLFRLAGGEQ